MKSKLISKLLGVGVAAGTVITLGGAFLSASPVAADTTKWTSINTPNWEDGVILPASDILDYDISGENGEVIYVIAEVDRTCETDNPFLSDSVNPSQLAYGLFKSTDGGVTWKDITQNVLDTDNLPDFNGDGSVGELDIYSLNYVAVAPDDADWVAVTGYAFDSAAPFVGPNEYAPFTMASKDGGDNFAYAGDMEDTDNGTSMDIVYDTEVSPETSDNLHVIVVVGSNVYDTNVGVPGFDMPGYPTGPTSQIDTGTVFRLDAGTWLTGSWEDTSFYPGWDGDPDGNVGGNDGIDSWVEVAGKFSPNYTDDFTFIVIGSAMGAIPYVQTGDFESKQWGEAASMPDPIRVTSDGDEVVSLPSIWMMGIALPADYDGTDPSVRIVFGYVDAHNEVTDQIGGVVFRIDNGDVSKQVAPSGDPLLASIAVSGDADTGKMMIGEYAKFDKTAPGGPLLVAESCAGVRVWHTEELDICCPKWELCCKCPSGTYAARVAYTPDGTKEYATTTSSDADHAIKMKNHALPTPGECGVGSAQLPSWGTPGDETAFSVSLDDATSWNQLGLIDTNIAYLSDVAVCPDCSVMYLATNNFALKDISFPCEEGCDFDCWAFGCDSVWRSFDNGDTWERVFHGDWASNDWLLLRLPCEDIENCCDYTDPSSPGGTIYLGVQESNDIWYSRDCGQCWTKTPETKITIQDFAVDTESTVYVLDDAGNVSKSTNFGRRWSDSVDTGLDSGHMITVCCGQGMVVVGGFGGDPVAWSDDGGDAWNTTDDVPENGEVHVACATTCDNTIYIAVDGHRSEESCIYRTTTDSGEWTNMDAADVDYTGIAVGKSDGTLYATTNDICYDTTGDTPCDRDFFSIGTDADYCGSAVARNLDPCETACCGTEDWDYLTCGLDSYCMPDIEPGDQCDQCTGQDFGTQVNALDICGCLTSATNTILYAIDGGQYDIRDGSAGTVWTYEDCASKTGPTLVSPADASVLDCMACEGCGANPFTLKWNRMCNSCSYDIEIMDDQGNVVISIVDETLTGTTPTLYFSSGTDALNQDSQSLFDNLVCGSTYSWHVREANTDCECIHSRWSDTWTFTVDTSSLNGVSLISPKMAANDIGTTSIGFSWTSVPDATSYSFVLSPNTNLSGALVSQEISTTAFNYAGPLENLKTYYWQVKAWKDTTLLSTSSVGVFTIAPKPVAPTPPVVVKQNPAPTITIPPAQQITPKWIYAIIGIGAALAVVVLVLIVKSRR